MGSPSFPADLVLAKLNMLETRKVLDEYEMTHGDAGSPEHQKLEREFSKATETYLRLLEEGKAASIYKGSNSERVRIYLRPHEE